MIKMDLSEFDKEVEKFIKEANAETKEESEAIMFEVWRGLKVQTPVKDGIARANWNVETNNDSREVDENKKDKSGSEPYPNPNFNLGDSVNFTNALGYAEGLDAGKSSQAKQGITFPVARKIKSYLRNKK